MTPDGAALKSHWAYLLFLSSLIDNQPSSYHSVPFIAVNAFGMEPASSIRRGQDSNLQSSDHEPDELTITLPRFSFIVVGPFYITFSAGIINGLSDDLFSIGRTTVEHYRPAAFSIKIETVK